MLGARAARQILDRVAAPNVEGAESIVALAIAQPRRRGVPKSLGVDSLTSEERRRFLRRRCVYLVATPTLEAPNLRLALSRLSDAKIGVVQLRLKNARSSEIVDEARALRAMLAPRRIPLILNDRVELVRECGASGVHLGAEDASVTSAREILGPEAIIGATAHSVEEAVAAEALGADYLGVGPIFSSRTKQPTAPRGVDWLREMIASVRVPCFAIGGIRADNVAAVARTGVHGVAVCEALIGASDPASIASQIQSELDVTA
jgi:thiamine-phosphate pyrophosphorylase